MSDEGGEAVCWLDRVCPDCGALAEHATATCWRCGRRLGDRERGGGEEEAEDEHEA